MRVPNMRTIAIAVLVLSWPAVAHASKDCMTKPEARKVYRTSYLFGMAKVAAGMPRRVPRTVTKKWEPYGTGSRRRIKPNRSRKQGLNCRRERSER
jgi:hypothetical protein